MIPECAVEIASMLSLGLVPIAISRNLRQLVIDRQEGICAGCGEHAGRRLEVHHIVPKVLGGGNNPDNLIGLCGPEFNDCHDGWDQAALSRSQLPDGTALPASHESPNTRSVFPEESSPAPRP